MYDIKIRGNDINGGKLWELLYKIKDRVQQESIDYIEENRSSVVKNNQKTLFALNIIYFVVVVGYLLASLTVFSEWQVTGVYARAVAVHLVVLPIIIIRYRKKTRSYKEVSIVCKVFQLYVMTFAGIMSIVPIEMNQPAVYYMPMAVAFVVAFTYTFYQALELVLFRDGSLCAGVLFDQVDRGLFWLTSLVVFLVLFLQAMWQRSCILIAPARMRQSSGSAVWV